MSFKHALFAIACLLAVPSVAAGEPLVPGADRVLDGWLRVVYARLVKSVRRAHGFPRSARVRVRLVVHRDGSVSDVHAIPSSDPDARYARLAERMVAAAGPFAPMPNGVEREQANLELPLRFDVPSHVRRRGRR